MSCTSVSDSEGRMPCGTWCGSSTAPFKKTEYCGIIYYILIPIRVSQSDCSITVQCYTNSGWLGVQYREYSFYESNILYIGRLTIHYLLYSHSTSQTTIITAVAGLPPFWNQKLAAPSERARVLRWIMSPNEMFKLNKFLIQINLVVWDNLGVDTSPDTETHR